jgi:electron transport complex protein RnfG
MPAPPPEPGSFSLIATLGLAGLFSGIALVGVYTLTLPAIERNRRARLEGAIFTVLEGAASFKTLAEKDGGLVPLNEAEAKQTSGPVVYAGYDAQGALVGFAVPGAEPGYADVIHGILGYDPVQKVVVGFQVLESRETPGLGDKIMKNEAFQRNFEHLAVDPPLEPVTAGKKTRPNQVETITGATISSKTVVRMLRKSLERWRGLIDGYVAGKKG